MLFLRKHTILHVLVNNYWKKINMKWTMLHFTTVCYIPVVVENSLRCSLLRSKEWRNPWWIWSQIGFGSRGRYCGQWAEWTQGDRLHPCGPAARRTSKSQRLKWRTSREWQNKNALSAGKLKIWDHIVPLQLEQEFLVTGKYKKMGPHCSPEQQFLTNYKLEKNYDHTRTFVQDLLLNVHNARSMHIHYPVMQNVFIRVTQIYVRVSLF